MQPQAKRVQEESTAAQTVPWTALKDRYLIGKELGRGGFAVTYLAIDKELASRPVVVKILNRACNTDSVYLEGFKSEIAALARIDHPHVVGVLDAGELPDGQPFLVLQFVPGDNLRKLVAADALPLPLAARLILQLSEALDAAHEAGVIHRDIKPENVMISLPRPGEEQAKLIDFGVAGLFRGLEGNQAASVTGTFSYMAPERFLGQSSKQSDIYELGILAYEMVTGTLPFPSAGRDQHIREQESPRLRPRDLRKDLSVQAETVILKALAFDPKQRYQSAAQFGRDLSAALLQHQSPFPSFLPIVLQSRTTLVIASLSLILLSLIAAARFLVPQKSQGTNSIAVLPFQVISDDRIGYLSEGITESLIDDLSSIPTLKVASLSSVMKYANRNVDPQKAGHELGVSGVIEGSILKHGPEFEISTSLIDVNTGVRRWGSRYSSRESSLPAILEGFATSVTDQLRITLSGPLKERIARQYRVGTASYQDYLKARVELNTRTVSSFNDAIRHFEQVNASDPLYAPAYAGLADTYALMAAFGPIWGGSKPTYALERARTAAEHALQLDGTLAEAYNARAMVELQADYNWAASQRDYLRALSLNPNSAEVHEHYALELSALGQVDDGLRQIVIAEELEPDNRHYRAAHGMMLFMARRYDESLAIYNKLAENKEGASWVADYRVMNFLTKGDARRALQVAQALPENQFELRNTLLGMCYSHLGQEEKATKLLAGFSSQSESHWWFLMAIARLSMGDTEQAIADLRTAYQERSEELEWIGVHPLLDKLRANSEFQHLIALTNAANAQR